VKANAAKNAILAFCPKGNHPGGVRHCVFVDRRVEKVENEGEFRSALRASLDAAGIPIDSLKDGDQSRPEGSPARDPSWRKAIRAELGLESAAAGEAGSSSTGKKTPPTKSSGGKKTKKGANEPPAKDNPK
jgi:hypothetical protein